HLGMFESNPLHRVVQLDVDTQVIRIELELIARTNAGIFVDIYLQRRNRTVVAHFVVFIAVGMSLVVDPGKNRCVGLSSSGFHLYLLSPLHTSVPWTLRQHGVT